MAPGWGYPEPRVRVSGPAPLTRELYERVESTQAEVTLADTDADVMIFSGYPDSIVLSARTNGALFTIHGFMQEETHELAVRGGETIETHVRGRRVVGRNLVAGSNAAAFVVGKWAAPREPE